jgi:putative protease
MEVLIGRVTHYFSHLGVAVVTLEGELKVGDTVLFLGHTTDLTQSVCSIEEERRKLLEAGPGSLVAIKVDEPVRNGDRLFKIVEGASDPENQALWKGLQRTQEAIFATYQPVFANFLHLNGLAEHTIGILLAAVTLDPGTISPERLQVRGPYTAAQTYMVRLHAAAEKGFLSEPEPGEFRLSRRGRMAVQKLIADGRKAMCAADSSPAEESLRLVQLLRRLVQACMFTPPPPDTWSIRLSYQLMPAEAPPMPFIEQALSCLQSYRDDAHLAAWQPSGLSAPAFEALTLIWRGQAGSLEALYDRLAVRGFELHDYKAALGELRRRGLLEGRDTALRLTSSGGSFRDQVEHDTDLYFFTPWDCLITVDKKELACLLSSLRDGLRLKVPV